jgi:hypothetical protein
MESMHTRKSKKYPYVIILLVGLFLGAAIPLAYGFEPHMDNALRHLQAARFELEKAAPNKRGHRERAIELVDQAMLQVREGIQVSR